MTPKPKQVQVGWPVNYQGQERHIWGVDRVHRQVLLDGMPAGAWLNFSEVEWIRECYRAESDGTVRKVRLF